MSNNILRRSWPIAASHVDDTGSVIANALVVVLSVDDDVLVTAPDQRTRRRSLSLPPALTNGRTAIGERRDEW